MRLAMTARARIGPMVMAGLALVVLALCTTGWLARERGLFQDDAQVLFEMFQLDGDLLRQATEPLASPTRLLVVVPELEQQLALFDLVAFLAAALTMTASSDWLTASPVAIGYHMAILLHACGAIGLTLWSRHGARWALAFGLITGTAT